MTDPSIERLNWRIIHLSEVPSTMDVAAERARTGCPAGTVVKADHQVSGRGRHGRVWLEQPGTSLLATVVLRPSFQLATNSGLSRLIADVVAAAIAEVSGLSPVVKEPNDVMISDRKVCGILCQTSIRGDRLEYLLVGIGLNVNVPVEDLPFETATSLLAETGKSFNIDSVLTTILRHLPAIHGLCDSVPVSGRADRHR